MTTPIPSIVGRLLGELSWEGRKITDYRRGGRGYENVLMAEVLQALDFLPRAAFLGSAIRALHDSATPKDVLAAEIEDADVLVLPGDMYLTAKDSRKISVQPDAVITSPSVYCILEAKRIRTSCFQPQQLAREFVLAHQLAESRQPFLLLLLGSPPPVPIQGRGRMTVRNAILSGLPSILDEPEVESLARHVEDTIAWITWAELAALIRDILAPFTSNDLSIDRSIRRIAQALLGAIEWHGNEANQSM
jgi:hypothetical protein